MPDLIPAARELMPSPYAPLGSKKQLEWRRDKRARCLTASCKKQTCWPEPKILTSVTGLWEERRIAHHSIFPCSAPLTRATPPRVTSTHCSPVQRRTPLSCRPPSDRAPTDLPAT